LLSVHLIDTVKLKLSMDRSLVLQEVEALWISGQSAHESGKVVSSTHWPSLPLQEIPLVLISVRGWLDSRVRVQVEELCQWKISVTSSGTKPTTFWLVVQFRYRIYQYIRWHLFTALNFQENTCIHISQVVMLLIVCILNILELNIYHNIVVLKVTQKSLCQCHCQHFHYWMISCLHELPSGGHEHLFHSYLLINSTL